MEEEASSWIRRTKFSHTVRRSLSSSEIFSANQVNAPLPRKTSPGTCSSGVLEPLPGNLCITQNTLASGIFPEPIQIHDKRVVIVNKPRFISSSLQRVIPDVLKEAKSGFKRFSTPNRTKTKWFQRGKHQINPSNSLSAVHSSTIQHLGTLRNQETVKRRKETAIKKYFGKGGRRINAVETADELTIDMSKLFLGFRFAQGLHSRLYHGKYNDEPVAVKLIVVPDDDENGSLDARLEQQFSREVSLLSRLQHPNVVKFIGAHRGNQVYCILTEFVAGGSLRSYLHKLEHKSLPLQKLIGFALDIARGMEYVHSQRVVHRDLKPENVLIEEGSQRLKVADLGIGCEVEYCYLVDDEPGTYRWMAPEMIKKKPYGRKVDVYSFGLVLWEMVAGKIPYKDMNPVQAAFAVVHKNVRPVIPGTCPAAIGTLIEQCWSVQPERRPEFWQIVKVLEQFQSCLAQDETLPLFLPNLSKLQDEKMRNQNRRNPKFAMKLQKNLAA